MDARLSALWREWQATRDLETARRLISEIERSGDPQPFQSCFVELAREPSALDLPLGERLLSLAERCASPLDAFPVVDALRACGCVSAKRLVGYFSAPHAQHLTPLCGRSKAVLALRAYCMSGAQHMRPLLLGGEVGTELEEAASALQNLPSAPETRLMKDVAPGPWLPREIRRSRERASRLVVLTHMGFAHWSRELIPDRDRFWIPPLRERPEDLGALFSETYRQFSTDREDPNFEADCVEGLQRNDLVSSGGALLSRLEFLREYSWPGNRREFERLARHAHFASELNGDLVSEFAGAVASAKRRHTR